MAGLTGTVAWMLGLSLVDAGPVHHRYADMTEAQVSRHLADAQRILSAAGRRSGVVDAPPPDAQYESLRWFVLPSEAQRQLEAEPRP